MSKKDNKRTDSKGRRLRQGEIERSSDGYYVYRWTDRTGKRHSVTANTLEKLRIKEAEIEKDKADGIRAFCATEWPAVRLPVATQRYQWPGLIDHFSLNHNDVMFRYPLKQ